MAATSAQQQWPSLDPNQQKLLLEALSSNRRRTASSLNSIKSSNAVNGSSIPSPPAHQQPRSNSINPSMLNSSTSESAGRGSIGLLPFGNDSVPDFSDTDFNFSPDQDGFGDLGTQDLADPDGEHGEKRKSFEDDDDDDDIEEGDLKRRESDDKTSKKPGRKPLTSEPTTVCLQPREIPTRQQLTSPQKRKAQNRAAQRAFRERKEKHLKDLEQKVIDLEKASESANHENGVLRAQVDRLSDEVKQYKRRFSTNASLSTSPSNNSFQNALGGYDFGEFDFNFPRFGANAAPQFPTSLQNGAQDGAPDSQNDIGSSDPSSRAHSNSLGPKAHANSYSSNLSAGSGVSANSGNTSRSRTVDSLDSMFDTSFLSKSNSNNMNKGNNTGLSWTNNVSGDSTTVNGSARPSHDNHASPSGSGSVSSASPSTWQNGNTSSCCTSPDPIDNSLKEYASKTNQTKPTDGSNFGSSSTPGLSSMLNFLQRVSKPANRSLSPARTGLTNAKTPSSDLTNFDWLASQNGGAFDPVLFGDYRDTQEAVIGGGDFSGGLFESSNGLANTFPDLMNDPFSFNLATDTTIPAQVQPTPKSNLMEQVNKQRDTGGDEYDAGLVMPRQQEQNKLGPPDGMRQPNLLTCHKIW